MGQVFLSQDLGEASLVAPELGILPTLLSPRSSQGGLGKLTALSVSCSLRGQFEKLIRSQWGGQMERELASWVPGLALVNQVGSARNLLLSSPWASVSSAVTQGVWVGCLLNFLAPLPLSDPTAQHSSCQSCALTELLKGLSVGTSVCVRGSEWEVGPSHSQ